MVLVFQPSRPAGKQATSRAKASSVPGIKQTAMARSSTSAKPRVPVPKSRVTSLSPTFAGRDRTLWRLKSHIIDSFRSRLRGRHSSPSTDQPRSSTIVPQDRKNWTYLAIVRGAAYESGCCPVPPRPRRKASRSGPVDRGERFPASGREAKTYFGVKVEWSLTLPPSWVAWGTTDGEETAGTGHPSESDRVSGGSCGCWEESQKSVQAL